jgi:hypothetical protein
MGIAALNPSYESVGAALAAMLYLTNRSTTKLSGVNFGSSASLAKYSDNSSSGTSKRYSH